MTARPNSPSKLRGQLLVAAKAAVTAALLGWLIAKIDLGSALAQLSGISPAWAAAAVVILGGQVLVTGWRWELIARVIEAPIAMEAALRLTLVGHFFSQTLPSAIGGDAVRAFLVAREGMPVAKAASSVVIDRVTALVLMVVLMVVTAGLGVIALIEILVGAAMIGSFVAERWRRRQSASGGHPRTR